MPEYFLASDRDEVASFLDRLGDMGVRYLVGEEDGAIVACGGVAVSAEQDARMCWGMVRRDLHRGGIGTTLLAARLVLGAEMGATTASLATIPSSEGFFAKLGFSLTGSEKDHYAPGLDRRDYVLNLDEATLVRVRALLP